MCFKYLTILTIYVGWYINNTQLKNMCVDKIDIAHKFKLKNCDFFYRLPGLKQKFTSGVIKV